MNFLLIPGTVGSAVVVEVVTASVISGTSLISVVSWMVVIESFIFGIFAEVTRKSKVVAFNTAVVCSAPVVSSNAVDSTSAVAVASVAADAAVVDPTSMDLPSVDLTAVDVTAVADSVGATYLFLDFFALNLINIQFWNTRFIQPKRNRMRIRGTIKNRNK